MVSLSRGVTVRSDPYLLDLNNVKRNGPIHASGKVLDLGQASSITRWPVSVPASVAVAPFLKEDGSYDYLSLHSTAVLAAITCDTIIDRLAFASVAARHHMYRSRGLSISAHGLADVLLRLGYRYGTDEARLVNVGVFEAIYHGVLEGSCGLARTRGPYPGWSASPSSNGRLYMDMFPVVPSQRFNFDRLRMQIAQFGLRNSVLTSQPGEVPHFYCGIGPDAAGPHDKYARWIFTR